MTGSFGHARVNDPQFAYKPLRFTPQGKRIDVGVYRQAEQAILQIENTGPGIAATDIGRIASPSDSPYRRRPLGKSRETSRKAGP
jgi:signal transduction histidine kinase